jgi:hypothetical protein
MEVGEDAQIEIRFSGKHLQRLPLLCTTIRIQILLQITY